MQNKKNFVVFFIFIAIAFFIFFQFFLKGLVPFPGNYLLAWYEPWKTEFFKEGVITIAHKAIADDTFRQIYPFKVLASKLLGNFELPLWNPYNGAGMPLMATMHVGFLTPFNLLFIFLKGYLAWSLYVIFEPLLVCIFTYLFCRKINFSIIASLFSTITFVFSGFIIARLIFGEYIYVFSVLPLILYILESFIQNPKTKTILILPLIILFLFISGHPQIILYVLGFSFIYLLWNYKNSKSNLGFKKISLLILLFLIGFGLAAIQLVPTFELFQQASINTLSSSFIFKRFLLPPQHLISILIPNYFGNQSTYNYWGSGDYIETVVSLGIIPCFFAYLGFITINNKKMRLQIFFLFTTLLSIILTLDWFGTRFLYSLPIPILSTGIPSRIFSITTFSISILAGFGFDQWLSLKSDLRKIINRIIPFFIAIAIILTATLIFYKLNISCNNQFVLNCRTIALRNTLLEVSAFIISISVFSLYIFYNNKLLTTALPLILLSLTIILGVYNSNKFLPFSSKQTILPSNNLIDVLKTKTLDGRVFGIGSANIKTDFATYFNFYDPNFYDPLYNKRYGELVSFSNTGDILSVLPRSDVEIVNDLSLKNNDLEEKRNRLLNLLSVKYLIFKKNELKNFNNSDVFWQDKNWVILKNDKSLPRAYLVENFEVITDRQQILKRLFDPSFNPVSSVILEVKPNFDMENLNSPADKIEQISYSPNNILLKTNTKENRLLVLTDNYYPSWKAYVDNNETKVYRANYTFRAIDLPSGKHKVEFKYQPSSVRIGAIISFSSLLLFVFVIIIRLRPKVSGYKHHR